MKDLNNGLIVLDKPSGPTSHQTCHYLKKILGIKKAGHSGTLDPKVTGVLPVGLGRSTRLMRFLLKSPKEYVCVMRVHGEVNERDLNQAFNKFTGTIKQRVPKRSAVKRQTRKRKIHELELLDTDGKNVLFRALVEAGTYLRVLCVDIGKYLSVGAHMLELRRTKVAHLTEKLAFTLNEVKTAVKKLENGDDSLFNSIYFPPEKIVEHLPKITVYDTASESLLNGVSLKAPGIKKFDEFGKNDFVTVFNEKNDLLMIGKTTISSNQIKSVGVVVRPEVVLN